MEKRIAVYLEDISTGGQTGFEFFEDESDAIKHVERVKKDLKEHKKESEYKIVKRDVTYDKEKNRMHF